MKPTILLEDESLLVIDKPAGITVIPDRIYTDKETLQQLLEKQHGKLFVVHRLDKETSGVICFARNETTHKTLSLQFQNHEVGKQYLAIVTGKLQKTEGVIDEPIAENAAHPGTMRVNKKGKDALTLYKVLEQFKHSALLQVEIKTGRTHQIRVHLAHIGHPLLVDRIYGQSKAFLLSSIKRGYNVSQTEERPTIERLTLHACQLIIKHPVSNEEIKFEVPLPKDMETVLKLLRKYD
jgi:23S rRNA pseudouridine955/2504/2580 synthase/23S rRNA pseudouridine1911/1915/1917 synthase